MKVRSVMCIIHWCNKLDVQVDSISKLEILLYVQVEVAYIHCISNKPPCFSTDRVCWLVGIYATFCGSGGIMSTARPELPFPCISQAKLGVKTSRRVK